MIPTSYQPLEKVGENPRNHPSIQAIYRNLRDARSRARTAERALETRDEMGRTNIGRLPEWDEVKQLALSILSEHACDIEVAAWLCEASVRIDGHAGLASTVRAITAMVQVHGADLHPQPEEDDDDIFAALAGLNGVGREGTLIQPLRLLPLVPGVEYGSCTLWDVETAGNSDAVLSAMSDAGQAAMITHLSDVQDAHDAFVALDAALTDLRGPDAPPFARILDILEDSVRSIRRLSGADQADATETADPDTSAPAPLPTGKPGPKERLDTREDALRALEEVARFFRRTEPHSPMSHALETLVRRGRMDFMSLLAELIPDETTRDAVLTTAGIKQTDDRHDSAD
ncbi:ImpA family type VI secretion system protein [Marivita sp. S0852]|uniref:type VI secretion system protein TssA n=1 Tax=Marivita sp. S0852 TaxID=3373893 RepID=UPI00398215FD